MNRKALSSENQVFHRKVLSKNRAGLPELTRRKEGQQLKEKIRMQPLPPAAEVHIEHAGTGARLASQRLDD